MASKTLKIYATSSLQPELYPDQDYFKLGFNYPDVNIVFDIPSNISKYTLKKLGYRCNDGANNYPITIYGNGTTWFGPLYCQHDTAYELNLKNEYTLRSLTYAFYGYTNTDFARFYGAKHPTETYRPYITIEYNEVDISNLVLSSTNLDEDITISWQGTCDSWTLQAILNGNVVKNWTGTTETSVTIPKGTLTTNGGWTFKLIGVSGDSKEITTTATLTRVEPSIISLEPDNVNQNADNNITVSWVTTNQQSYSLSLDNLSYSGTTADSLVIPAKTLKSGTKSMTLTITYTSSWGEVRTATKTVTFLAYATPNTPQLEDISIYNSATPTFNWTCSDAYTSYHFKISNSAGTEVLNTNEVVSSATSYTSTYALTNNGTYTIAVRVKNQFGLWSAWDSKTITTAFVVPNKPIVNIYATNKNSIVINFNIAYSDEFEKAEIWRKSPRSEWIRIAYNLDNNFTYEDEFLGSGTHYYKVRAIGTTGGIIESDVVNASISISNFNFANCDDLTQSIEFVGDPSVRVQEIRQIVTTIYAGCTAPKPEIGEVKYRIVTCSFTVEANEYDAFMDIFDSSEVILYRDCRGEKIYGKVTSNVTKTPITNSLYSIGFTFTEVSFIEKDMYKGDGNTAVVFFDGAYRFDGTLTFNGEGE
ncbi:hypothetical protein QTL86_11110 [Cellulosilyticum sp. ST5]|uniref:hypothetical protein n=1 Tax=Cellulosilyticum sp. ST5 TaxID=3055805 RepID=UPI003977D964